MTWAKGSAHKTEGVRYFSARDAPSVGWENVTHWEWDLFAVRSYFSTSDLSTLGKWIHISLCYYSRLQGLGSKGIIKRKDTYLSWSHLICTKHRLCNFQKCQLSPKPQSWWHRKATKFPVLRNTALHLILFMCVCTYVCVSIYLYMFICTCRYLYTDAHIHVFVSVYNYGCVCLHMYTYTNFHTFSIKSRMLGRDGVLSFYRWKSWGTIKLRDLLKFSYFVFILFIYTIYQLPYFQKALCNCFNDSWG